MIINLACTGLVNNKEHSPYIPITTEEIVRDVDLAIKAGVQIVHLHVRDQYGKNSSDPELYKKLITRIRMLDDGDKIIICVSTSGRLDKSIESRAGVLNLEGIAKPDMASLTLSSLNFRQGASINEPETVRKLAEIMLINGIKPELEVFDLGMANMVNVLSKEGLLKPPFYVNVILGNISSAQAKISHLSAIMDSLPSDSIICVGGLGQFQLQANLMGIMHAQGVRVGLEDNLWMDRDKQIKAKNIELIERVKTLSKTVGRDLTPISDLRLLLNIE